MKTFLQRKILRTKENAELQRAKVNLIDKRIEHHYEVIKQLKAAQRKRNDCANSLYLAIGFLVLRLSDKERNDTFN